jgi:hypothetical protein
VRPALATNESALRALVERVSALRAAVLRPVVWLRGELLLVVGIVIFSSQNQYCEEVTHGG